jgi:hypothetical protein
MVLTKFISHIVLCILGHAAVLIKLLTPRSTVREDHFCFHAVTILLNPYVDVPLIFLSFYSLSKYKTFPMYSKYFIS